jgi:hypothetical protein
VFGDVTRPAPRVTVQSASVGFRRVCKLGWKEADH